MRIAIVGSRDYPDFDAVRAYVRTLPAGTIVVSGGARGVDTAAEEEAKQRGLEVKVWPADWARYGRRAGYLRNKEIEADSDRCAAFWYGQSPGTKSTIDLFRFAHKPVEVFHLER